MHLWTDYEGKTIAGDYPLSKLLRSEGRNAFFSAKNPKGSAAVVRLTEAHFDEREMLNRWGKVVELHQPSLLSIENFGETTVDGVTLAYAVLEPDDANLADMLKERPLTTTEALQVAKNVASALSALHASGMVHEHVEPLNVFAVGEDVKLRSDCVRECVADMEFSSAQQCEQARTNDVRDLGTLLLRCLTLDRILKPGTRFAAPFDQIIPHALDGTWTLTQILSTLDSSAPATSAGAQTAAARRTAPLVPDAVLAKSASPMLPKSKPAQINDPAPAYGQETGTPRLSSRTYIPPVEHATLRPRSVWMMGIAAAILILMGWFFLVRTPSHPVASSTLPTAAPIAAASSATGSPANASIVSTLLKPSATRSVGSAATQPGWRVIAYTYNHQGPAEAQAARLNRRHPGLEATVFSPRGSAPYLVALSGPVSESQAREILNRARRTGAPHDTFIRRY
jgi:hypothetical protein